MNSEGISKLSNHKEKEGNKLKGMKMKRLVFGLVFGLVVLSLLAVPLITACAQPAPAPAPAPAPKPAPKPAPAPAPKPAPKPPPAPAPGAKLPDKLKWDISVWGGPRVLTYTVQDWADDMKRFTDGRWDVEVHYGGVLIPAKEGIDGLKAGTADAVLYTSMYGPGKLPLSNVAQLPFMDPGMGVKQLAEWLMLLQEHPAIKKELGNWNAQVLFPVSLRAYNYMGKVPIKKVEDFKGVRMRIDPTSGSPLKDFGAVITNMAAPEMYTAMERGMLDGVMFQWTYGFGSYKIYELSKYATNGIDLKSTDIFVYVNKDSWNALPDEWKQLANWSSSLAPERYDRYLLQADVKWMPLFSKAGVEVTDFPPEERAKLIAKAKPNWDAWAAAKEKLGLPGNEILEFAIAKRKEIQAKYAEK